MKGQYATCNNAKQIIPLNCVNVHNENFVKMHVIYLFILHSERVINCTLLHLTILKVFQVLESFSKNVFFSLFTRKWIIYDNFCISSTLLVVMTVFKDQDFLMNWEKADIMSFLAYYKATGTCRRAARLAYTYPRSHRSQPSEGRACKTMTCSFPTDYGAIVLSGTQTPPPAPPILP